LIDREQALALESRRKIFDEIKAFPGIHFHELKRRTGLAVGSLQYHLDVLRNARLVHAEKRKKFVRYFPIPNGPNQEVRDALSLLHEKNVRSIVIYLVDKKRATNKQLSKLLGLSPSTVSFHTKKLLECGLVVKQRRGKKIYFSLKNLELARSLLMRYKQSFFDSLVDSFVEIWEKM